VDAGDSFLIPQPGASLDSHLWMVLSDPAREPQRIVIVNLTSWRADKDQACVLEVGDHPFVQHRTCVNFPMAKIVSRDQLQKLFDVGKLQSHAKVPPELLQRIRQSVPESRMPLEHADILVAQGLIDV
jgi:hypothetical protein